MSATQTFRELTYTMRSARSPRRRHQAAIRYWRTWWGLSRQCAPGDHRDRRPGPLGCVCAATGRWEDRSAGPGGLLKPVAYLEPFARVGNDAYGLVALVLRDKLDTDSSSQMMRRLVRLRARGEHAALDRR
jgi:hypothetical protein